MRLGQRELFPVSKFRAPARVDVSPPAARLVEAALGEAPFVILDAPAGYGKSTALAVWATSTTSWNPIWVRLDAHDNDAVTLACAISTAIEAATGAPSLRTETLLAGSITAEPRQLATALANDLDDIGKVTLVLDDLHHLTSRDALELLEELLDGLGATTRIAAASRVEPPLGLTRRRVRRDVVEIGVPELLLDQRQIESMLTAAGIRDPRFAESILERSGGWPAAAVLLVGRAGVDAAPQESGTGRVDGEFAIDEFLRTEVFADLDPHLQRFVLATSLLRDFDLEACKAVLDTADVRDLFAEIRRRGLIEWGPGDHGGALVARYHDRIAEFLRRELAATTAPAELVELHRRAASVSSRPHAIDLLLAVGEVEAAATLVADAGRAMLDTPGARVPRTWLASFDEPARAANPWLRLLTGTAALEDGDIARGVERLDGLLEEMQGRGDRIGALRAGYARAEAHLVWGEVGAAAALTDSLELLTTTADERVQVLCLRLWLEYFRVDWDAVAAALEEAFASAIGQCHDLGRSAIALGLGTEFLFAPTGPVWLSDRCAELSHRIENDAMARTSLELIRAAANIVSGDVNDAEALVAGVDERAIELGGLNWLGLAADRVRLALALAVGDHATVDLLVDAARRVLSDSDRHQQERAMYAYALARSGWSLGRPERVRAGQLLIGDVASNDRPDTVVTDAVIAAMVHRNEGDVETAQSRLASVRDLQHAIRFCFMTGLPDLELAAILLELGETGSAIETARPTLLSLSALGAWGVLRSEGADTHRAVLEVCTVDPQVGEFARDALAGLASTKPFAGFVVRSNGERITTREFEVLRLVMAGRSNREIATALFIGERTVKSHMTTLMRKLEVSSRTAAIARARDLGIE